AIEGIPSAGFSLLDYNFDADFTIARQVVRQVVSRMLLDKMDPHTLLNVNIPKIVAKDFKGLKICRQAHAKWEEEFDHRQDPRGEDYYWMVGRFLNMDKGDDTDVAALRAGFASVVPVRFDLTDYTLRDKLLDTWKDIQIL
ncbi:MAG: 5'/3'-nucleotidase SurE, partial [Sphingobacteriales bacterium]